MVLVPPGIDRIFLHDSGANDQFGAADIDLDVIKNARLFHFGYPPLMKRMQLNDGRELIELFQSVKEYGHTLLEMRASVVAIKCGEHGIFGFSADNNSVGSIGPASPVDPANWSNRELFSDSYHVENVLSSTGAGDNSIGGFLSGLLRGLSFEETLELACMAGANATKAYSAVGGVVPIEEMRKEIASNPPKNSRDRETDYWTYLPEKRLWKGGRESVL